MERNVKIMLKDSAGAAPHHATISVRILMKFDRSLTKETILICGFCGNGIFEGMCEFCGG